MDIQQAQQAQEQYLRADQAWRDAHVAAVLMHRGEGTELVVEALAAEDCTKERHERLEAMIVWENYHLEFTAAIRRPEFLTEGTPTR